jgi:threonine dehydrogenase-like Zn-dependent dehydrogenase
VKAAQIVGHRRVEIVDAPMPDFGEAPAESMLIRTLRSSICGSDLPHFGLEHPQANYPLPPGFSGHECIGTVVASKSKTFGEGDRVMALPLPHHGLAEYYISRSDQSVLIPDGLSSNEALMAQPLGTVIWALRKLPPMLHMNVAVIGQGPIGQLMASMSRSLGARRIIVLDKHQYRLDISLKMGATDVINVERVDAVQKVADLTDGGMADIVIEAVGHNTDTVNQAMRLAKSGGTVLVFGVPDIETYPIDYSTFFRRNLRLIASVTSPEPALDHGLAMELIARGQIDVRPMISHELPFTELPFTEAQHGIEIVHDRRDNALKVVFAYPQ